MQHVLLVDTISVAARCPFCGAGEKKTFSLSTDRWDEWLIACWLWLLHTNISPAGVKTNSRQAGTSARGNQEPVFKGKGGNGHAFYTHPQKHPSAGPLIWDLFAHCFTIRLSFRDMKGQLQHMRSTWLFWACLCTRPPALFVDQLLNVLAKVYIPTIVSPSLHLTHFHSVLNCMIPFQTSLTMAAYCVLVSRKIQTKTLTLTIIHYKKINFLYNWPLEKKKHIIYIYIYI